MGNTYLVPRKRFGGPLVHGAVHPGADDCLVIQPPTHACDPPPVPPEIPNILASVRVVHHHHASVHRGEQMAAVGKTTLGAILDRELFFC